jgi:predicted dehydrogenase
MTLPDRESQGRRLRAGIVGGGNGAFIGPIHRIAAELDGQALLVAGALSSDPARAMRAAAEWRLPRAYEDFRTMAIEESRRKDGIDFAIIATPNDLHAPVARAFLDAGIPVVCDKPLALSAAEADELVRQVEARRLCFALTHPYAAYPLVREARERVARGALGELRRVVVEYQQDWLREPLEHEGHKQASWRTDPQRSGPGGCIGDIGTHAQHLLEYVAGRPIVALCADLTSFVAGRVLDDDANVLLRLEGGAKGVLTCSQIACGEENALTLRLYGAAAGLEWRQQEPNTLIWKPANAPWQLIRTGSSTAGVQARLATRAPAGHPEGYIEAFANIYSAFIADVRRCHAGETPIGGYPTVQDGARSMRFIQAVVESSRNGASWLAL